MDREIGLLDTSVFVHSLTNDEWSGPSIDLLDQIESGRRRVYVDAVVVHEMTYAYLHYRKGASRDEIATAVGALLDWPGVVGPTANLRAALARWQRDAGLGFVDAYLCVRAEQEDLPVYTVNRRDFLRQGVDAPDLRELMGTG